MNTDIPLLLERNLAVLAATQPKLHERLCWPVEGEHFARQSSGGWHYNWRGASLPAGVQLEHAAEFVAAAVQDAAPQIVGLIFGVGGGELVNAALESSDERAWVAWDRDPWILRSALSVNDWSEALSTGRLALTLNADLIELTQREFVRVDHPLFGAIYSEERELLEEGLNAKRALLCCGKLFVDSVRDALRGEGYSVYPLEPTRQSSQEHALLVSQVGAHLALSINFVPGMPEFCEEAGLEYVCWEIDPALDTPHCAVDPKHSHIFSYRRANVAGFESAGFHGPAYLPLAADPEQRKPLELNDVEREHYSAPISFVGASMVANARTLDVRFADLYDAWRPGARPAAGKLLAEVATVQREDFSVYRVPELIDEISSGWRSACAANGWEDPADLAAEVCAAEKRLNYVAELADHGIQAWGDEGWKTTAEHGVNFRGPARHGADVPRIYNASRINLDIGRLYQNDIVTMRVFDICACGGFVLAEYSDALAELFELGVEVESYRTFEELREKVAYYLEHEDERQAIAKHGRAAVLARHRISERVRGMLARVAGPVT